jgi:hypothetical protein
VQYVASLGGPTVDAEILRAYRGVCRDLIAALRGLRGPRRELLLRSAAASVRGALVGGEPSAWRGAWRAVREVVLAASDAGDRAALARLGGFLAENADLAS